MDRLSPTVHIKRLSTGRGAVVGLARRQAGGDGPTGFRADLLALAGKQAVWTSLVGGNCIETSVFTATLDERIERSIDSMTFCSVEGNVITAVAGDASTLAFAHVGFEFEPVSGCSRVNIGGTARVVGSSPVTVPGSVPAVQLAVSAGRVAVELSGQSRSRAPGRSSLSRGRTARSGWSATTRGLGPFSVRHR